MYEIPNAEHHPAVQELVDLLKKKTQNQDDQFFLAEVAYFLGKIASTQRATVLTKDRGEIPVNIYSIALASSGYGKNHSVNIMEGITSGFREEFLLDTMPKAATNNIRGMADRTAAKSGVDPDVEFDKLMSNYERVGEYLFTFDSGTLPALKQLRTKILLADCGSVNFQVDELGSNMMNSTELLNGYLELYDKGTIKTKLVKNTAENVRDVALDGATPANMLLFGTPAKLFDGGPNEQLFNSFLETGYARRSLFGVGQYNEDASDLTPEQLFDQLTSIDVTDTEDKWTKHFSKLGTAPYTGWKLELPDEQAIELIRYRMDCDRRADAMSNHQEVEKAEMKHRYFKSLKLAGTYAFIDESMTITEDHLNQAIYLVETLGESFKKIMTREPSYARLARYIAEVDAEVTHADLNEALPFYRTGRSQRDEMIALATAWGYKQHILIKKSYVEGIEFFSGETLKKTDLSSVVLSYSEDWARDYSNERVEFNQLHQLCTQDQFRWVNHHLEGGHRHTDNVIPGCNLIVLDVDGTCDINLAAELLEDYTFFLHTTKSHTVDEHRFRIVLPIDYEVKMDADDFREFIDNIRSWLPFEVDHCTNQIAKAWSSHKGCDYMYNEGTQLLESLKFIPKTRRNEEFIKEQQSVESFDALEAWFAQKIARGNRNNNFQRFAFALADSGIPLPEVRNRVLTLNKRIETPLDVGELEATVLKSVAAKYTRNI